MAVATDDNSSEMLATSTNAPSGDFTMTFWYFPSVDAGDFRVVWTIGGDGGALTDAFGLWHHQGEANNPMGLFGPPSGAGILTTGAVTISAWHFIAIVGNTGDGQAWSVWVDGTETSGTSGSGYANGPLELLGISDLTGQAPGAWVGAFKAWTIKLTDEQVQAERGSYLPQYGGSLWCCAPLFRFDALQDISGQGNGFTATGTVSTADGPPIMWGSRATWLSRKSVAAAAVSLPPFRRRGQVVRRSVWV